MRRFTPDPERENEALWGDKRGIEELQKERLKHIQTTFTNAKGK